MLEGKILKSIQGGVGIPKLYWYGSEGEYNIMAMELLGQNLEDLLHLSKNKFSLTTLILIGEQLLKRIEYFHNHNYLHRDIKPENFAIGTGKKQKTIYLIDYGLAKQYKDKSNGMHIPQSNNKLKLTGTA